MQGDYSHSFFRIREAEHIIQAGEGKVDIGNGRYQRFLRGEGLQMLKKFLRRVLPVGCRCVGKGTLSTVVSAAEHLPYEQFHLISKRIRQIAGVYEQDFCIRSPRVTRRSFL